MARKRSGDSYLPAGGNEPGAVTDRPLPKDCNRPVGAAHGSQLSGCPVRRRYFCWGAVALDGGFLSDSRIFIVTSATVLPV